MKLKEIKNLKSFRILILPENAGWEAKSKKFSMNQAALLLAAYTFIVAIAGFLFFGLTPLNSSIFQSSNSLSSDELEKINLLNQRLTFLSKELEGLKSTNERLRYAIMLGDSTLLDSLQRKKDTTDNKNTKPVEGNIFGTIINFLSGLFVNQSEDIFFKEPVKGYISREFFPEKGHMGIDYVVKTGTPVYAAASGFIIFADYTTKDGYMMIINHSNDYISIYKHCTSLLKKERDVVLQGEIIALSGNSGEITTGPHLHFEIWKNGKPINPKNILINY